VNFGVSFAPLVSTQIFWAAIAAAAVLAALLFLSRTRGATIRALGLALIVLALANPSLTREDRDPLSSVAVVVVDKSPSQSFGDRTKQTDVFLDSMSASSRPANRTARPMARGCSPRSGRRSPTCRPIASPAPS